jgi:hypothetical protein
VAEGNALAAVLGAAVNKLPWNLAWQVNGQRQAVCTPAVGGGVELKGDNAPTITLLSPGPEQLKKLWSAWARELKKLQTQPEKALMAIDRGPGVLDIEALAAQETAVDDAVPNGSSIAILVEHRGASALLCADAHPTVLVPALKALIDRRKIKGRLPLDVLKVSHHGSKANTTQALVDLVKARHIVISTNNAYFNHPDPEAMARLLLAAKGSTLWFTYDTSKNRIWDDAKLKARYGYAARYPAQGAAASISLMQA